MATTTYNTTTTAIASTLKDRVAARIALARTQWQQYRTFRTTIAELSRLSNRDLADLGIARGDIHWLAMEAAYGKSA
ncbi:DUF1127 domain-containing protein [Jannaschia ovalis]|uniref:DUF1127 domain-containing protein n=1 Tax=Jannaschia ovalis TaxID=3038773 RepID=A0ABY8LD22_9RHOB|nr:DUF1127 domain-containing protein [Jannaschia sp. GRR-S6-38]WGH77960.1 DUF1127 domain-containing protein [Jannaschia sp. GRR-S6-38]